MMGRPPSVDSAKLATGQMARVWVLQDGHLRPIRIIKGIQNQKYFEVVMAPLAEGDSVVSATNGATSASATATTNPFIPRMPGGGRTGGGGPR